MYEHYSIIKYRHQSSVCMSAYTHTAVLNYYKWLTLSNTTCSSCRLGLSESSSNAINNYNDGWWSKRYWLFFFLRIKYTITSSGSSNIPPAKVIVATMNKSVSLLA